MHYVLESKGQLRSLILLLKNIPIQLNIINMDTKGTAREGESIAHVRSNMTLRLSGHISIFGLVFFVLKSLLEIVMVGGSP